jgi:hypothetical protein
MKPWSQHLNGPGSCTLYTAVISLGIEFMSCRHSRPLLGWSQQWASLHINDVMLFSKHAKGDVGP